MLFKFGHCVLEPFWGLGSTYTIDLRLIGKRVVVFLVVLIELFRSVLWLRANIEKEQSHGFFATVLGYTSEQMPYNFDADAVVVADPL